MLPAVFCLFTAQAAAAGSVHHDLSIRLSPADHRLDGRDAITVSGKISRPIRAFLSPSAEIQSVVINNQPARYTFKAGRLVIEPPKQLDEQSLQIGIIYTAIFNDPAPTDPINTDNPGFGVTGTIAETGTFLLSGSGWYPAIAEDRVSFSVTVDAPAGTLAVTSGKPLGHSTQAGRTLSRWEADYPVEGLALSAGPYEVDRLDTGSTVIMTYFLPRTRHLAADYLQASARYIDLYEDLFGPYPFHKFAIVENFFPTGYGFPSYTLMGGRVLRLPFIIHTSLGHEIVHCWWGNGVYPDYGSGNWSEALATYTADYLYKEQRSDDSARDYRLQIMRDIAALITPENDFSLRHFRSRYDPVTRTIGYGKGAMVFHMLRCKIGDDAFWGGLRDLFRDKKFKEASWDDFRLAFQKRSGQDLKPFFTRWIDGTGVPFLELDTVRARENGQSWTVTGEAVQSPPAYHTKTELALVTAAGEKRYAISLTGRSTPFSIISSSRPVSLTLDPDANLLRQLAPAEIPPSVNAIKGAESILVILTGTADNRSKLLATRLIQSMGLKNAQFIDEEAINRDAVAGRGLLLIGYPARKPELLETLPDSLAMQNGSFTVNGTVYDHPNDTFFGVFRHPYDTNRVMGLLLPAAGESAEAVAAKITHYGKYSYLVFSGGKNREKGTWPVERSPVEVAF